MAGEATGLGLTLASADAEGVGSAVSEGLGVGADQAGEATSSTDAAARKPLIPHAELPTQLGYASKLLELNCLAVEWSVAVPTQLLLDSVAEHIGCTGFAVNHKDLLWGLGCGFEPLD